MRIAYVVSSYHPRLGGVETHVEHLAQGCAEAGDDVTVLTHRFDGFACDEWMGAIKVRRFPFQGSSNTYQFSLSLFRYLRAHATDFDLVHVHSYHTLVGHPAVGIASPMVFTPHYHGTGHTPFRAILHRLYRPAGARLLRAADAVICVSDAERALLAEDFPGVVGKVVTIPNGTDLSVPAPVEEWTRLSGPMVLTVGRLERYKNVDLIINAFRSLPSAATLVIVGDGPDRARLERRAAEPGWPVMLTGNISKSLLNELCAKATVVASGSDHEAFGMTIAAGLVAGARVVASDITAHAEVARLAGAQAAVTLVDPRDTQQLVGALTAALAAGRFRVGEFRLPRWDEVIKSTRKLYVLLTSRAQVVSDDTPVVVSESSAVLTAAGPVHTEST